jgi:hypothetical protein
VFSESRLRFSARRLGLSCLELDLAMVSFRWVIAGGEVGLGG